MPAKRELTMRQLRYMLRPQHDGVSAREIGRTLGVARSTIQDNLRRAQASGIAWPVPAGLTDDILEQRLFARGGMKAGLRRRSEPDWGTLARELKRAGVNLVVLWRNIGRANPRATATAASAICSPNLSAGFRRSKLSVTMRQTHVGGDKLR
jgi:transposase